MFDTSLDIFIALSSAIILGTIILYLGSIWFKFAISAHISTSYAIFLAFTSRGVFHLLFAMQVIKPELDIMTYEHMLGLNPFSNIHTLTVFADILLLIMCLSIFESSRDRYNGYSKTSVFVLIAISAGFLFAKAIGVVDVHNTNFFEFLCHLGICAIFLEQWICNSENYAKYIFIAFLLGSVHYLFHLKFMLPEGSITDVIEAIAAIIALYGCKKGVTFVVEPTHDAITMEIPLSRMLLGIFFDKRT